VKITKDHDGLAPRGLVYNCRSHILRAKSTQSNSKVHRRRPFVRLQSRWPRCSPSTQACPTPQVHVLLRREHRRVAQIGVQLRADQLPAHALSSRTAARKPPRVAPIRRVLVDLQPGPRAALPGWPLGPRHLLCPPLLAGVQQGKRRLAIVETPLCGASSLASSGRIITSLRVGAAISRYLSFQLLGGVVSARAGSQTQHQPADDARPHPQCARNGRTVTQGLVQVAWRCVAFWIGRAAPFPSPPLDLGLRNRLIG